MSGPIVSFQNVSIVFGRRPDKALALIDRQASREEIRSETGTTLGVADATLDVAPGEILVLMGPSGSGKSTLIRAVNGLAPVTRGRVLVDTGDGPVDPRDCGTGQLRTLRRRKVAMVFQQFALLPWRSVVENVALGLQFAGVSKSERRERAKAQLDLVGLSDWADSRVSELSGGMQQRVGLARAFATDAPILLMDEPFSALDPLIRAKLQDELLDIQERAKKTILFVSHDLDEAFKLGNRIAIMEGGRIIQVGTARDIVRAPASPYVADFVAHVSPIGVLTAADVMTPLNETADAAHFAGMTKPDVSLNRVVDMLGARGGDVAVADGGRILGRIGDREIVAALSRRTAR